MRHDVVPRLRSESGQVLASWCRELIPRQQSPYNEGIVNAPFRNSSADSQVADSPIAIPSVAVSHLQRSLGLVSAVLPCIFLTLLPVQVFPETVKAVFVSQPLPEPKGTVSDTALAQRPTKHKSRAHKARRAHHH